MASKLIVEASPMVLHELAWASKIRFIFNYFNRCSLVAPTLYNKYLNFISKISGFESDCLKEVKRYWHKFQLSWATGLQGYDKSQKRAFLVWNKFQNSAFFKTGFAI